MEITLHPRTVALTLLWVVITLGVVNSGVLFLYFYLEDEEVFGLVDLFDFDIEGNVPTFFSASALLFCSALLGLIARSARGKRDGTRPYWIGLAAIFLFLAIDEAAAVHEGMSDVLERYMEARGFFYFLWVIPYGIAAGLVAAVYLRFVWKLPKETRNRFIAAGALYVAGALGVEMLGAMEADLHGTATITYSVLYMIEELLEMLGVVLFLYALLCHLARGTGRFSLTLDLRR